MKAVVIEYLAPTRRAFARMRAVLFEPFDLKKWLILGFTAWLATLADGGGGGGGGGSDFSDAEGDWDFDPGSWGGWIEENMLLAAAIGLGILLVILFIIAVVTVLLWLSSRGKFMFLDNLVHDRARISQPWKEFRAEGNSLFLWRLVLAWGSFFVFIGLLVAIIWPLILIFKEGQTFWWGLVVPLGLAFVVLALLVGYVTVLLEDFIVPVMYRERVGANAAWRRFLALHRDHWGDFLVYFLWIILLWAGAVVLIVLAGLLTCCVGFLIMILPYVGTVFLLPLYVFFRYLGPEFLRQYGEDHDILGGAKAPPLPR